MIFFIKFSILSDVGFNSVSDLLAVPLDLLCESFSVVNDFRLKHVMPLQVCPSLYLLDDFEEI